MLTVTTPVTGTAIAPALATVMRRTGKVRVRRPVVMTGVMTGPAGTVVMVSGVTGAGIAIAPRVPGVATGVRTYAMGAGIVAVDRPTDAMTDAMARRARTAGVETGLPGCAAAVTGVIGTRVEVETGTPAAMTGPHDGLLAMMVTGVRRELPSPRFPRTSMSASSPAAYGPSCER